MFNKELDLKNGIKTSFKNIKVDMDKLKETTANNSQTIKELIKQNKELAEMIKSLTKTLNESLKKTTPNSGILTKIKKNKRAIIKSRILELVSAEKYSISEIRDILVNKDQYCSKATFYRYADELKHQVEEISIQGKTIIIPTNRAD